MSTVTGRDALNGVSLSSTNTPAAPTTTTTTTATTTAAAAAAATMDPLDARGEDDTSSLVARMELKAAKAAIVDGGRHGALLRLFESEFFDMTMAMTYLNQYPESPELQVILCGHINRFSSDDIEFYLPQFLALFISSPAQYATLRDFLLQRCARSVQFSVLLTWLIDAERHSLPAIGEKHRAINLLRDDILTTRPVFTLAPELLPSQRQQQQQQLWRYGQPETTTGESAKRPGKGGQNGMGEGEGGKGDPLSSPPPLRPIRGGGHRRSRSDIGLGRYRRDSGKKGGDNTYSYQYRGRKTYSDPDYDYVRGGGVISDMGNLRSGHAFDAPDIESGGIDDMMYHHYQRARRPADAPLRSNFMATPRKQISSSSSGFDVSARDSGGNGRYNGDGGGGVGGGGRGLDGEGKGEGGEVDGDEHGAALANFGRRRRCRSKEDVVLEDCMKAEMVFVKALMSLGDRLVAFKERDTRRSQLHAELALLNLNLPARVYLPLCIGGTHEVGARSGSDASRVRTGLRHHHVVRVPPLEGITLNSKEKAPYMLQVEVIECERFTTSAVPNKLTLDAARRHHRSLSDPDVSPRRAVSKSSSGDGGQSSSSAREAADINGSALSLPAATARAPASPPPDHYESTAASPAASPSSSAAASPGASPHGSRNASWGRGLKPNFQPPPLDYGPLLAAAAETPEAENSGVVRVSDIRRRLTAACADPVSAFARQAADPSAVRAKEPWAQKVSRIRRHSPYGHLPTWRLIPVIIKSGDDLRQEMLATQLLALFQTTWVSERLALWIRPIRILVTSSLGGMIEVVGSAVSLHQAHAGRTLLEYFYQEFGDESSERFLAARRNFVESLAAYSLFCYFVQVKDRHNGNILITNEGHILHIDFGFIISNSPGKNMGFESAPFKLTLEFIEVMGGMQSDMFKYFKILILQGFIAARKHRDRFVTVVETMQRDSNLPCFVGGVDCVRDFADRFQLGLTEEQLTAHVEGLIQVSVNNMRTKLYDRFQYMTNGIK
eukprot:UC1_evm1s1451